MKHLVFLGALLVGGCAHLEGNYIPQEDDLELTLTSSEYKNNRGIPFINERKSTLQVFYTDSGCSSFEYDEKYIGQFKIDNTSNSDMTVRIPRNKNIFITTHDTWTGVGYFCRQGVTFRSTENGYVYDIKGIKRSLGNACVPHDLKLASGKALSSPFQPIPMKDIISNIVVDKKQCNENMANK